MNIIIFPFLQRALFTIVFLFLCNNLSAGESLRLSGREVEAIGLATAEFKKHHVSASGDLTHYTVDLERSGKTVEVRFVPDQAPLGPNEAGTGGGTAYGSEISYVVSLKPLKIVRYYLAK